MPWNVRCFFSFATLFGAATIAATAWADSPAPTAPATTTQQIKVAVYSGPGTSGSLKQMLKALESDPRLAVKQVTPESIRADALVGMDVVVHPGGSSSTQGIALGEDGRTKVRDFLKAGGGYVGVCAGAYLATCDYEWSLHILDAKVLDKQHWARGTGNVDLAMSPKCCELFGSKDAKLNIYYHQGPLLAPADNPKLADYDRLATFETEIAKNGAPEGVMRGTDAFAAASYEKGRVFCFSPHPERTPGLEPMIVRAAIWAAGKESK